jgi:hypothetical protein
MDVKQSFSISSPPFAAPGTIGVRPLLLKPQWMNGLSERLLVSHYENNYGGALRRFTYGAGIIWPTNTANPTPQIAAPARRGPIREAAQSARLANAMPTTSTVWTATSPTRYATSGVGSAP